MNQFLPKALKHLTGHEDIDSVSVENLESLVNKYPYFPVVHLLLSQKLKAAGSDGYLPQVQKTALYFSNPYWLHYQLMNDVPGVIILNGGEASTLSGDPSSKETSEDDVQIVPDQFHPEPEVIQEEIESGEGYANSSEVPEETYNETAENQGDHNEIAAPSSQQEIFQEPDAEDSIAVPKPVSISDEEFVEDEKLLQEIAHPDQMLSPDKQSNEETNLIDKLNDQNSNDPFLGHKVVLALEGHNAFAREMEERTQALINPPDPSNPKDQHLISYEPYHTIDYFASQGIQLILENDPKDKLGKQLKSFTQWLKHMKRLGPEDALDSIKDTHLESTIQGIADSSNITRDIVTETMAEVLEKQGKTDKAIQLYTKLSFLIPGKSAYFADKIQKLKGI